MQPSPIRPPEGGTGNSGARSLADAALDLARHDLAVFPLVPRGKVPLIPKDRGGNGVHDATTDPDRIRAWWDACPNANVGLACSKLWALDVDGEEGLATLADLEDLNRWIEEGPASMTGSGGLHLLFPANDRVRNSVKRLGPGLDTRAAGGYIVGPGSIHPNGNRYDWLPGRSPDDLPLTPAPAWLVDLLDPPKAAVAPVTRQPKPKISSRYVEKAVRAELERVATSGKGQRNVSLFCASAALGRFLRTGELDAREIGPALVDAGLAAGLPHHEAERTVMSGLRRGGDL